MRRDELESLCRAVASGEEKMVQNLDSLYAGRLVACQGDRVTVEAFGRRFEWDAERCRPAGRGVDPLGPPSNV
jgi:hypothetical protein